MKLLKLLLAKFSTLSVFNEHIHFGKTIANKHVNITFILNILEPKLLVTMSKFLIGLQHFSVALLDFILFERYTRFVGLHAANLSL